MAIYKRDFSDCIKTIIKFIFIQIEFNICWTLYLYIDKIISIKIIYLPKDFDA